ncbi:DUF92 domain-containing protein [candidate division KSB1 bacterium]|nr:DUF92 domain-containing protein [candidate division KSB1 bacterium]
MDWILGLIFFTILGFLIFLMEYLRNHLHVNAEITRKFVHLITGIFIAMTPLILRSNLPVLSVAFIFIPINYYAIERNVLKSMHDTRQKSYGTVFYPLAFFILVYLLWDHYISILIAATLVLAIADTSAALVGNRIKNPITYILGSEKKSVQGSATMLLLSAVIVFCCLQTLASKDGINIPVSYSILYAVLTAIIATVCESISFKGSDNLSVPLGTAFTLHYLVSHHPHYQTFLLGIVLALFLAVISYKLRFLDGGGTVSMFILGVVVFGTGGWKFSLPILSFFLLSSLISKLGKTKKKQLVDTFQKSSRRDLGQVLANGGVAGILVVLWNYYPAEILYYMFVGSIAAANSDTWATEIGVFSKSKPRHILTFDHVPVGSSGGVSLLGTMGALAGSAVISFIAYFFIKDLAVVLLITLAGFLGSIFDSIVGGTIQVQYQCPNCHKITEKIIHCISFRTRIVSGIKWIDNDIVNSLCTFSGAIIAGFLLYFSA